MTGRAIDFAAIMPFVARALLGEPNPRLSTARELRYGTHGSLAVHVDGPHAGTWRDHEAGEGGGVLALVKRETGARDNREAMAWLREGGFLDGASGQQDTQPHRNGPESRSEPIPGPDDTDARRKVARRVWCETRALSGTPAERYLHARMKRSGVSEEVRRELVARSPALRFHPALRHESHPPGMLFPTLVAGVQDVHGGFLGVHRIYLDREGADKANVALCKASLGSPGGGAVRLGGEPEQGRLLVGEGIESTLSAMARFGLPGWAALGALRIVELPEHVRDVVIAADRDAGGLRAAAALARWLKVEGRHVVIRHQHKGDFNDAPLMVREATP